ncbi:hypothetical protein GCM10009557_26840 [Virgisporangium ochraceum]|uniref:Uncharacterized protein n=1 Tax=Virgisporangium ochraceum TaxID=65505 RepID=A0A8J3ZKN9_9ACTN|nr:hypothetical protein [Virgisporangium ochraceum]GIJ65639.1 hypothetical protein Voc01_005560 [Virgisporangium ochraceum]
MGNLKKFAIAAVVVFVIAYNPSGAAAVLQMLGGLFVDLVDGAGAVAVDLNGGQ